LGGVGALAVNVPEAFGNTALGFALSYAFMRSVLVVEYFRTLRKTSSASYKSTKLNGTESMDTHFIKRFILGFSLSIVIWVVAPFIPVLEIRLIFWIVALIIDFVTPLTAGKLHSQYAPDPSYLPERLGAFVLIVLGESIAEIVIGMTGQVWNAYSVTVASLGLCISFGIGRLYFENIRGLDVIQAVREKAKYGMYYV
jgi:low temperature requirement protein LtrA